VIRKDKESMVGDLSQVFAQSQVGFLVDFRGMTVGEVTALRRDLHEAGTRMRVLKNRLAKRAMDGTPFEPLKGSLTEPRALVFSEEPVGPAKVLSKYSTESEKFKLIAGLLVTAGRGAMLSPADVKALANLPSREELVARLLFVLNAPLTNFVRTLNEIPASFVRALAAVQKAKEEQAA